MRVGWIVSAIAHVGAVMITLVSWPATTLDAPPAGAVVPVEVVTIAEYSNVRAIAPEPDPEDMADTPSPPDEPVAQAEAEPEPAPAPPQPRQERRRQTNELDLAALNQELLVDKQRPSGKQRNPRIENAQRGDRARQGAGLGTAEQVALEDRLRAIMRAHFIRHQCWREPADATEPGRLVVTVRIAINRNGGLEGQPELVSPTSSGGDPEMRAAIDNALRAVRLCDPFPLADDPVAAQHYDLWRRMEYTFRPRS